VWFVSVSSVTETSSVTNFTFSAASGTVNSTVHKLYRTAMFSCTSPHTQYIYTIHRRRINPGRRNFTALLSTLRFFGKLQVCLHDFCWLFWNITQYRWVNVTKLHGTENLCICKAIERKMRQNFHCTYNVILWRVRISIVAVEKQYVLHILSYAAYKSHCILSGCTLYFHIIAEAERFSWRNF